MHGVCAVAGHKVVRAAALVTTIGWFATILWYLCFASIEKNWGYSVITLIQAAAFWGMARSSMIPIPLFVINAGSIVLYFAATLGRIDYWYTAFVMNRLFELVIVYICGCAIFRIRSFRKKGALSWSAPDHPPEKTR